MSQVQANQKNVMAAFVHDDETTQDGEAHRKIDINELNYLLA